MSKTSTSNSQTGIGCSGLLAVSLTVLFVYLKLTHQIDWHWVWVLAPAWVPPSIVILILLVLFLLGLIGALLD